MQALSGSEAELRRLLARGFELQVPQLSVRFPQGALTSSLHIDLPEKDSTEWPSLLLGADAAFDISIPVTLLQERLQQQPGIAAALAFGYLKKDGEQYIMQGKLSKGRFTINDAPIPLPFDQF